MSYEGFHWHDLDGTHGMWVGCVPDAVALTAVELQVLWASHPAEFVDIVIHDRHVLTPRWQEAYGRDYAYTGQVNRALPLTPLLARLLDWGRTRIDDRLNGILVNWYDGALGHYIGPHRDSTKGLLHGAPIVTISAGEQRIFRLRPMHGADRYDLEVTDGTVIVMPYDTNLTWKHEVPKSARRTGRRISITLRAFK